MAADGFLNLLKPPGMTSHDVVSLVRARLGVSRVGHLGTLDPAAAGVLPICVGRATRLFQFASGRDKAYRAEVAFGVTTDTLDTQGEVVEVRDSRDLTEAALAALLAELVGEMEQAPPAFSAARVGGRRLHELARRGEPREGRPKRVRIERLELVDFAPGRQARALMDVVCSAGTYVRVLAADLGRNAGCGAHLAFLVRTRVGPFELSDSLTVEELAAAGEKGEEEGVLLPADWPLADLPAVELDASSARAFAQGTSVRTDAPPGWPVKAYGPGRSFLGLGEIVAARQIRPRVVLAGEGGSET
jgi:tRNA pseudouridine55 synthase